MSSESPKKTNPFFARKTTKKGKETNKEAVARRKREKAEKVLRARELYANGMIKVRISEELGITPTTLNKYLEGEPDPKKAIEETPEPFAENLKGSITEAVDHEVLAARDDESRRMLEIAENQATPADKYQAYVAANAIKLLRDSLQNIRGPRTVRELSELDQLIRRNLGLNPSKGGGNAGSLQIDISILNNAKAAKGGASVVVDAELSGEDDEDE